MNCPYCGNRLDPSNQQVCQHCGTNVQEKASKDLIRTSSSPTKSNIFYSTPYSSYEILNTQTAKNVKYSKRIFILGTISLLLALLSFISGIPFIFFTVSSIQVEMNWVYFSIIKLDFEEYYSFLSDVVYYSLEESIKMSACIVGICCVLFGLAGIVLGIIAKIIKLKVMKSQPTKRLAKIGGLFAILGIILSTFGPIIGWVLYFIPFNYLLRLNYYY
ncbi:MAG: membrane protein of unknown function [Promethearchaeota archaeon]|nr:MAG: membrane protein of unknown function [Candidatus Lokiarchaeota archaeon]